MKNYISAIITTLLVLIFSEISYAEDNLTEISGIARRGDTLLLVSDNSHGVYYQFTLTKMYKELIAKELKEGHAALIELPRKNLTKVPIHGADLAMDLESIEVLTNGETAVLSEQLNALIVEKFEDSKKSISSVIKYHEKLGEVGGRGLEGLAARTSNNGTTYVAALWEGGYFTAKDLPVNIEGSGGLLSQPLIEPASKPLIFIHEIESKKPQKFKTAKPKHPVNYIKLKPPTDIPGSNFDDVDRYRATDLVWHKKGFIALLGSRSKDGELKPIRKRYKNTILVYFDIGGDPVLREGQTKPDAYNIKENIIIKSFTKKNGESLVGTDGKNLVGKDGKSLYIEWDEVVKIGMDGLEGMIPEDDKKLINKKWADLIYKNWEGMDWYEEGKSLILVYDDNNEEKVPSALVINIPEEWK